MRKFLNKAALLFMLLTMGIFTACGSMSAEDVELLDSVLTTVLEVAEQAAEAEDESAAVEQLEVETAEAESIAAESAEAESTEAESTEAETAAEPEEIQESVSENKEALQETETDEVSVVKAAWAGRVFDYTEVHP